MPKTWAFEAMPVSVPARAVLLRLGMRMPFAEKDLAKAGRLLRGFRPGGCARLCALMSMPGGVLLEGETVTGAQLAAKLEGCSHALVMASTLGPEPSAQTAALLQNGQAEQAVWVDAAASVAVDAGLDFLMRYAEGALRPGALLVEARRYSPGYGDCGLENQAVLMRLLGGAPCGITLLENSWIMTPEKSVLAICGVRG